MVYSESCSDRNAYKWMCGYHFPRSARKALAQSLIQPTHYTTTDMYYKASPAPLKDYRQGCSVHRTRRICNRNWCVASMHDIHSAYMQGTVSLEGTTYRLAGETDSIV